MKKRNIHNFLVIAAIILLGSSETIIQLRQREFLSLPYDLYSLAYYIRASMALACIFFGVFDVAVGKEKKSKLGKFLLIFIGACFSLTSISPSIVSLFFSKEIDRSLLDPEHLKNFKDNVNLQKTFLRNIGVLLFAYLCLFFVILKRVQKTKGTT